MTAEELLRAGQPDAALKALQEAIRKAPADARLRVFLFQLTSILGLWTKAAAQLEVLADLDADSILLSAIYRPVVEAELARAQVFAGKALPQVFGEPEEWTGLLIRANQLAAEGSLEAAAELRDRAFDAAPESAGSLGGERFEWIADADARFGPVLEIVLNGTYMWAPFARIKSIEVEPPSDLRNFVWVPAKITWANGGNTSAFIPARYPGTETSGDPALRLGRKTEWVEKGHGYAIGIGQRMMATDSGEYPLLDLRQVELNSGAVSAVNATAEV